MSSISDVQWVVSVMDDELHYPKDLFYDCEAVRSILGASAPYAVPKVSIIYTRYNLLHFSSFFYFDVIVFQF